MVMASFCVILLNNTFESLQNIIIYTFGHSSYNTTTYFVNKMKNVGKHIIVCPHVIVYIGITNSM